MFNYYQTSECKFYTHFAISQTKRGIKIYITAVVARNVYNVRLSLKRISLAYTTPTRFTSSVNLRLNTHIHTHTANQKNCATCGVISALSLVMVNWFLILTTFSPLRSEIISAHVYRITLNTLLHYHAKCKQCSFVKTRITALIFSSWEKCQCDTIIWL